MCCHRQRGHQPSSLGVPRAGGRDDCVRLRPVRPGRLRAAKLRLYPQRLGRGQLRVRRRYRHGHQRHEHLDSLGHELATAVDVVHPPRWTATASRAWLSLSETDLHPDPARHHRRLRPRVGPARGTDMTTPPLTLQRLRLSPKTVRKTKTTALNAAGVLVALITLFPILWLISTAFKPSQEIYSLTPSLLPAHPTLGNFGKVISGQASGIGTVWLFFRNS